MTIESPKPLTVTLIAKTAHEVNRAYCASLGDTSQPSWESAPEWQRDSAVIGVSNIMSGVVSTPAQSHESWLKHKFADGWVWGKTKNAALKEHPCMVPYGELPPEQRVKDELFLAVVRALTSP